jgi:hypothetical protein
MMKYALGSVALALGFCFAAPAFAQNRNGEQPSIPVDGPAGGGFSTARPGHQVEATTFEERVAERRAKARARKAVGERRRLGDEVR